MELSRRQLVGSSAACLLIGSGPAWARQRSEPAPLADAHVHLFNMADLPAAGFFRYVVLPKILPKAEFAWPAIIDLAEFLKRRTITAAQEAGDPEALAAGAPPPAYSKRSFSLLVAKRITAMSQRKGRAVVLPGGSAALATDETELFQSYARLAQLLNSRKSERAAAGPGRVEPATISDLVEQGEAEGGTPSEETPSAAACPEAPTEGPKPPRLVAIANQLAWIRRMMQSRESHLERYVRAISSSRRRPRLIVNLLVDYDRWLGDCPRPGSDHHCQIALWSDLASRRSETIDIRTFAGFDPLKDAEQFIRLGSGYGRDSDLWRYVGYFCNGRPSASGSRIIHGLKLYPPMGFKPSDNRPDDFKGEARALREVKRRWREPPLAGHEIHHVVNESLRRLFEACDSNGIPLLAHSYHSNEAGFCFGARAGPSGWLDVLKKYEKLRLCLGHFASAADFETAMAARDIGGPIPRNAWPLQGTEALLKFNTAASSRVFADIGYMSEFLVGSGSERAARTEAFFRRLEQYCRDFDPGCRHIMFGSDWIMLGQEPRNAQYLETIERGLVDACWEEDWKQNFLYDNLRRFLAPVA